MSIARKDDPDYTDSCMEETGFMCDYCCIVNKKECSRDIKACDPQHYSRSFKDLYIVFGLIGSVMCGCPLLISLLKLFLTVRCFKSRYSMTNGVSCLHLIARICCIFCFKFDKVNKRIQEDPLDGIFEGMKYEESISKL